MLLLSKVSIIIELFLKVFRPSIFLKFDSFDFFFQKTSRYFFLFTFVIDSFANVSFSVKVKSLFSMALGSTIYYSRKKGKMKGGV